MFSTIDKALAAMLGAALPLLFAQLGPAPEILSQFSGTISVVLSGLLAWAVPNKESP